MSMNNEMRPVHPGEILGEELEELGLSANALAKALDVPTNRVTAILKGQRGVTADTALRLARYFGTTPQLWQNLQKAFELRVAEIESGPADRGESAATRNDPCGWQGMKWQLAAKYLPLGTAGGVSDAPSGKGVLWQC